MKVDLNDVIECIEHEGELLTHYYNINTGVIIYVEDDSTSTYKAENINDLESFEEWERELIITLHDFKENKEDYIQLPDHNDIDEYGMMVNFVKSLEDEEIRDNILKDRKGKDDFRNLRESIENNGVLHQWYDYREGAEKNIAIRWCEENNIEYK